MHDRDPSAPLANLRPAKPLGLLAWIVAYKVIKAIIAATGAIFLFHIGRESPVAIVHQWIQRLHLDPEGRIETRLLAHAAHFDMARLRWAVALLVAYTILYCVEAVGLFLERRWAEWLTVVQSALLVPWEIREIIRRHGPVESVALFLSVGVIVYLIWRMRHDDEEEKKEANPSQL